MEENIPRRLARFSRNQKKQNQYDDYSNYSTPAQGFEEPTRRRTPQVEKQIPIRRMPGMDYRDVDLELDKKNFEELQKIREKNLVEKLALEEIKRFRTQNKRMPNSKEEEQIAENLYNQLKNNPIEGDSSTPNLRGRRGKRRNQSTSTESSMGLEFSEETQLEDNLEEQEPIKIVDSTPKKERDEFDLGLGEISEENYSENFDEDSGEISELEDFSLDDNQNCPNCKKQTEKVVYCPNCGTAFCEECATIENTNKLCPKCGTKVKI